MKTRLISIALLASLTFASSIQARTFSLTIENGTKTVIEAFYASPTGEDDWEEDLFGDRALAPGARHTVRFEDNRNVCRYDLRFEFRGSEYEPLEDTQNLCEVVEYEVTE